MTFEAVIIEGLVQESTKKGLKTTYKLVTRRNLTLFVVARTPKDNRDLTGKIIRVTGTIGYGAIQSDTITIIQKKPKNYKVV